MHISSLSTAFNTLPVFNISCCHVSKLTTDVYIILDVRPILSRC